MSTMEDAFGPVIHSHTREDAFEDGVLVDLMQPGTLKAVKEAGFTIPVAMTGAVFGQVVRDDGEELLPGQDLQGRLWDALYLLREAVRRNRHGAQIDYSLIVQQQPKRPWQGNERKGPGRNMRLTRLKAVCGPDDTGAPCITIMQPDED